MRITTYKIKANKKAQKENFVCLIDGCNEQAGRGELYCYCCNKKHNDDMKRIGQEPIRNKKMNYRSLKN